MKNWCKIIPSLRRTDETSAEKIIEQTLTELCSEQGVKDLRNLLEMKLSGSGIAKPLIERIIANLDIIIVRRTAKTTQRKPQDHRDLLSYQQVSTGKTLYSVDGKGMYGVGRLALTIVQEVVRRNPSLTFYDLTVLFNTRRENIKSVEEIKLWKQQCNDSHKNSRWFERDTLTSCDGIKFAVSTQWGIFNIDNIILVGRRMGLEIKKLN